MGVSSGSDRIYNLPDSNATWTRVSDERLKENVNLNAIMSNSFGFGGTNATLVFEKV